MKVKEVVHEGYEAATHKRPSLTENDCPYEKDNPKRKLWLLGFRFERASIDEHEVSLK